MHHYDTKFPIILPRDNEFASLLVQHCHQKVLHDGMKETLNEQRKRFWIPQARNYVKRIIHRCLLCKWFESKPFCYPAPRESPEYRLSQDFPFTTTTLDQYTS